MYFIVKGFVLLKTSDEITYTKYSQGSYFGEFEIIRKTYRINSVMASGNSFLLSLKKSIIYDDITEEYSEFFNLLIENMVNRNKYWEEAKSFIDEIIEKGKLLVHDSSHVYNSLAVEDLQRYSHMNLNKRYYYVWLNYLDRVDSEERVRNRDNALCSDLIFLRSLSGEGEDSVEGSPTRRNLIHGKTTSIDNRSKFERASKNIERRAVSRRQSQLNLRSSPKTQNINRPKVKLSRKTLNLVIKPSNKALVRCIEQNQKALNEEDEKLKIEKSISQTGLENHSIDRNTIVQMPEKPDDHADNINEHNGNESGFGYFCCDLVKELKSIKKQNIELKNQLIRFLNRQNGSQNRDTSVCDSFNLNL